MAGISCLNNPRQLAGRPHTANCLPPLNHQTFRSTFGDACRSKKTIKPLKFKESNKYPGIEKDVAFVVDKSITNEEIINVIKKSGGRLLTNIEVFDA